MSAVLTPSRPAANPTPAGVLTPPPTPQLPPQPFRWTLEQYRDLDKIGFFNDKRTILLDGEIIQMVMPKPPHDVALGLTNDWLRRAIPAGHHLRNQMSFDIGDDNDLGPDLAVVKGTIRDYATAAPREAPLIVEVADTSLIFDTTTKAEKYATAKVPDYWVLDLENRQLIVFREPVELPAALGANAYRQRNTYGPDAEVSPLAAPDRSVKVADLLP